MVRGALSSIVLDRDAVQPPSIGRFTAIADGQVKMVGSQQRAGARVDVERQNDMEPALRVGVEVAARIGDERPLLTGRPIDLRRIAIEAVEINDAGYRGAAGAEDAQYVVHGFQYIAVSDTQSLVGWL